MILYERRRDYVTDGVTAIWLSSLLAGVLGAPQITPEVRRIRCQFLETICSRFRRSTYTGLSSRTRLGRRRYTASSLDCPNVYSSRRHCFYSYLLARSET